MISTEIASLTISVINGLIKFSGRLDRLLAEKVATRSGLTLTLPAIDFSPGPGVLIPELTAYLNSTADGDPGQIGKVERGKLKSLLPPLHTPGGSDLGELRRLYALAFPERAVATAVSADAPFLMFLLEAMPEAKPSLPASIDEKDPQKQANLKAAALAAAFSIDPGQDTRQLGYPVRVGLLVLDVLAEFGAANTQLFVRDERLRTTVQTILERFAAPDLETFDEWSPLLRHVLSSTLNGLLDARAAWQGENPWVGAVLGALADAREAVGANGDDYLLGLLQGKGYPLLIGNVLDRAAGQLDQADASTFQKIVATFLHDVAPTVRASGSFEDFFQDHWTDLVHAGLVTLEQHGPALLKGQSPVLQDVLKAAVVTLAQTPGAELLKGETLVAVLNAAMGAVATHPEVWANSGPQWLGQVLASVTQTISDQGVKATFTGDGLAAILRTATSTLAAHPEWLVKDPGLIQNVVGGVLKQVAGAPTMTANAVAIAAVTGALEAIAARPELIGTKYPDVVASFAGLLAKKIADKSISATQASDLATAAAEAVLLHPALFADATRQVAAKVTNAVLAVAQNDQEKLVAGITLVTLAQKLFGVLARQGAKVTAPGAISQLEAGLTKVLTAGLAVAKDSLGQQLDLGMLPAALAELAAQWALGGIAVIDANAPEFRALFTQIAQRVAPAH